jgi:hypothetical protein
MYLKYAGGSVMTRLMIKIVSVLGLALKCSRSQRLALDTESAMAHTDLPRSR